MRKKFFIFYSAEFGTGCVVRVRRVRDVVAFVVAPIVGRDEVEVVGAAVTLKKGFLAVTRVSAMLLLYLTSLLALLYTRKINSGRDVGSNPRDSCLICNRKSTNTIIFPSVEMFANILLELSW